MILSFNARDGHFKGKEVIDWYNEIPRTERSRKIIDILYSHIITNEHSIQLEIGTCPCSRINIYDGSDL